MEMKEKLKKLRGWLPKEPNNQMFKHTSVRSNIQKKILLVAGSVAIVIGCFFLVIAIGWMLNPIVPRDSQLIHTIEENKDLLSSIDGVVGVGIARNYTNNHLIGINVIVKDDMSNAQEIPEQIGDFTVYVKTISNITDIDRSGIFWSSPDF